MRIAYLSRGNSIHDRRFLEKMAVRGHDVHFISYHPEPLVEVVGVKTYHFDSDTVAPFPRFKSLQTVRHLRKLLKEIKPDILHSGWLPDHGFFGALSGFHPTLSMAWGSDVLLDPQRSLSFYWRIRHALAKSDHIIANAEHMKTKIIELAKCSPEKISLFAFGIELETFHPSSRGVDIRKNLGWENREILIMNRSFKAVYGINFFIEALASVVQARPQVGVMLIGEGVLEPQLRRRVQELGLNGHVRFLGRLDSQSMADYLNTADLYVSTSLSDGTSSSLLEAMACGLPVVVSDIAPNREWVQEGHNGFLVAPGDVKAIAQKIIQVLQEKEFARNMGVRNLALARERADWNKNFSKLEDVYSRLTAATRI